MPTLNRQYTDEQIDALVAEIEAGELTFFDSETCGLHGMMVLLQFAMDDGKVHLYDVWLNSVRHTLRLFKAIAEKQSVLFNASFDWFHMVKIVTIWDRLPGHWLPVKHIDEIAEIEPDARDGDCLKPKDVIDLWLHACKGPLQSLMGRDDIRIRRVPRKLGHPLAAHLEDTIEFDDIFFSKGDPLAPRWKVYDRKQDGLLDTDFVDVVLKFKPSTGLKFLAKYVLKQQPANHFKDVEPPKKFRPKEVGWAPFAKAVSSKEENWEVWKEDKKTGKRTFKGYAWPGVIRKHIIHWAKHKAARKYAYYDVVYTRLLYKHFGCPAGGDDDSVLACMVPSVRWKGYKINLEKIQALLDAAQDIVDKSPINIGSVKQVREYILGGLDEQEATKLHKNTKKATLNEYVAMEWEPEDDGEECTRCLGDRSNCFRCESTGRVRVDRFNSTAKTGNHPAAQLVRRILTVKGAVKEVEVLKKVLQAGRFHASFKVLGALSGRMSGADGLNPQGIKGTTEMREAFTLTWDEEGVTTSGGDFGAFEVTIADAEFKDPDIRDALQSVTPCECDAGACIQCGGVGCERCEEKDPETEEITRVGHCQLCKGSGEIKIKLHGLMGMAMFPPNTYAQVLASDGTEDDMYSAGKSGFFGMQYGGTWETLVRNFGIPQKNAEIAEENFFKMFPKMGQARDDVFARYQAIAQPGGIGSAIFWQQPTDSVECFMNHKRYFTLEIRVMKALFELARNVPSPWRKLKNSVVRRDRVQRVAGAVSSALYGTAFGIQGRIQRAALNHLIQSSGAILTKRLQRRIWDLQPHGYHQFRVSPMNIHDEVIVNNRCPNEVQKVVGEFIVEHRRDVPLLAMDWVPDMASWADKKGKSGTGVSFKPDPPKEKIYFEMPTFEEIEDDSIMDELQGLIGG